MITNMTQNRSSQMAEQLKSPAKQIRESLGFTQMDVCSALSIQPRTISDFENGANTRIETIKLIADFYNVSIDELLGREVKS